MKKLFCLLLVVLAPLWVLGQGTAIRSLNGLGTNTTFRTETVYPQAYNIDPFTVYGNVNPLALIVKTNRNVGVWTNNPTSALTVYVGNTTDGLAIYGSGFPQLRVGPNGANFGQMYWDTTEAVVGTFNMLNPMRVAGSYVRIYTPSGEKVRVVDSGNVGIGEINPVLGRLQIHQASDAITSGIAIQDLGYTDAAYIWHDGEALRIDAQAGLKSIALNAGPTGSGRVGIGTNTPRFDLSVARIVADGIPDIELVNDQQGWVTRALGTGNDQWELVDVTGTEQVSIGAAINQGPVWIPGGLHSTNVMETTVIGFEAGVASTMSNGLAAGYFAGREATNAAYATFVGPYAGYQSTNSYLSLFAGYSSGAQSSNAHHSVFTGPYSGRTTQEASNSVFSGNYAGSQSSNTHHSVFLGSEAGTNSIRPYTLLVDTMGKGNYPLIYGEFDTPMLRINGNLVVTGSLSGISSGVFTNVRVYPGAYNEVPFITYNNANAASLVVNSNGYVGLGTNDPLSMLHVVKGDLNAPAGIRIDNTNAGVGALTTLKFYNRNTYSWSGIGGTGYSTLPLLQNRGFIISASATDGTIFYNEGNDPIIFAANNAEVARITGDGLVGIGTNTPGEKLAVANVVANGDVAIELQNDVQNWKLRNMGTVNDDFRIYDATDSRLGLGIAAADGVVYVPNGLHSTNIIGTTVLGISAGADSQLTNGIAVGKYAGLSSGLCENSLFIGYTSGYLSTNCYKSCFNGQETGVRSLDNYLSVCNGYASGYESMNAYSSLFNGAYSGFRSTNSYQSTFEGYFAGSTATNCYNSVFDGYYAGREANNSHHSVFLGNGSGTNTVRPYTLRIDTIGKATNQTELIYGEFDTGLVKINDRLQVYAETNGVAPPTRVGQPVSAWAQLAYQSTNALDMVYEAYTNVIVNATYDDVLTNHFYADPAIGTVTNVYAGFYEVSYSFSVVADAAVNGDELEAEVFFDGVGDEHTASLITVNATSGFFSLAKEHAKYLPAGTRVELKAKNIADVDQDFSITRIVLLIKSL